MSPLEWLGHDLPAWVVALLWVLREAFTLRRRVLGFFKLLRRADRQAARLVRRWLGVSRTEYLTQAQYDAIPCKDPETQYNIIE